MYNPKKIFIETSVRNNPNTIQILSKLPDLPVQLIDNPEEEIIKISFENDPIKAGKNNLFLSKNKGSFLKKCPGTQKYLCCNYYIINMYNNCQMECSYCILQNYLNNPFVTIYTNIDDMVLELEKFLWENKNKFFRMGTGELGDSLALDDITEYSKIIIPFFSKQKNALLELKTKSTKIDNLLNTNHKNRIVVSWSLNPDNVIKKEEQKTPPLHKRLKAAFSCQEAGYILGFHFDPLIFYSGWKNDYKDLISQLYTYIKPEKIIWISLGTLRYPADLKPVIKKRFPKSKITTEEFITGNDGKMRYLKGVRKDIYSKIISWIKKHDTNPFIYYCMESDEIWHKTMGWSPKDENDLDLKFQDRVKLFLK